MINNPCRLLILALFVSLALNLFLGGALLSTRFVAEKQQTTGTLARGGHFLMGRGILAGSDESSGKVAEEVWRQRGGEIRTAMQQVEHSRHLLTQRLAEQNWNQSGVEETMAELRSRTGEAQRLWHQAMMETAARLPREARAKMLDPAEGHPRHRRMGGMSTPPCGRQP